MLGLPIVLKIPDGSFSRGIIEAETAQQLAHAADELFQHTALLIAQEFMYTGTTGASASSMARPWPASTSCRAGTGRSTITRPRAITRVGKSGGFKTLPIREAPSEVVKLALRATAPIGDGLYGVDLKADGKRVAVIEVNDNPSIDAGVEDAYLGEDLYRRIMEEFLRRLERKRLGITD